MTHAQPARRRNAADSRERLLAAAADLFAERGYDRTTVRELGQRAGVDPALIARYFGSKASLYLAALMRDREPAADGTLDLTDPALLARILDRVGPRGHSPTLYAAVQPHADPQLQAAAMQQVQARLVDSARRSAVEACSNEVTADDATLRAQIATAALAGVVLSRTSGAFDELRDASSADVGRLVAQMLSAVLTGR